MTESHLGVPPNQKMQPDEVAVYTIPMYKGTFRKRKIQEFVLTQYRAAVLNYEDNSKSFSLPLEFVDDIITYDTEKISNGNFSMIGTRQMYSAYFGKSKSKSNVAGSLIILSYKYDDLYLRSIQDVNGLCRLIEGMVKQRKAQLATEISK